MRFNIQTTINNYVFPMQEGYQRCIARRWWIGDVLCVDDSIFLEQLFKD